MSISSSGRSPAGVAPPPEAAGVCATPVLPDMGRSYDAYFASGLYLSRYPMPNRRTLRLLRQTLPTGGRLLDYGAGEGRYCFALARDRGAEVVAADISAVARDHLAGAARGLGLADRVHVCDPGDATYRRQVGALGGFNVVLLGFGVLGHIAGHAARIALLSALRASLAPGGRLVLGLPNAARRFRAVQAACAPLIARGELEPGDICYERQTGGSAIALYYHLYRRDEIRRDLGEAGFTVERLTVESMLPESAVTHSALLGRLDDLACGLVPVDWGYGYLVMARPAP
ncbi:class I SAM-dependent methyltransferase [Oleomonas cavernae]|uniref:Class I SAM-dependent methyltransferase n=1 Tax=Oleomonas cavernae TaxID=2320859 RepID=A0A418VUE2_9PROT|nr:class I SAM-dependent methyltransferase [Oleomonas cavernae]RJF80782.1 class I SAM-dependent methyltransferase [Oleomonas cavernae]